MKVKCIFISLILSFTPVYAQTNWISQPLPQGINILATIDFSDYNNGFAGGWGWSGINPSGKGIYTNNGGNNWLSSSFPDSIRSFVYSKLFDNLNGIAVCALNKNLATAFNFKEYIEQLKAQNKYTELSYARLGYRADTSIGVMTVKTLDGGKTWQTVSVLPDSFRYIYAGYFLNENTGFIVAHADSLTHILKTTNGGTDWDIKFSLPYWSDSHSIVFSSPNNGIAVGYNNDVIEQGLVVYTNDGGENWNYQLIPETGNMTAASYANENTFYATGQNFQNTTIFKSTNAGIDWYPTSFQSTQFFLDGINFFKGTEAGFVYGTTFQSMSIFLSKTLDGGINWEEAEVIPGYQLYSIYGSKILDENNAYLCGGSTIEPDSGLILKTSNLALPVEQNSYNMLRDNGFLLEQNYPNPFNPSTIISWQSPVECQQTIKLYNILGFEIQTLFDGFLKAGRHSVEFNGSLLPSGIYFYKLKAGTFIQTKKMILLR